ncbi:hypothetical protein niasHT_010159 [Heterodera trifolii]|uniref:Protein kinase domain-containing protein n=1 Tax=Heterodera trifolii TaxID=157864 RepID=A0ABD2LWD8_9BILA
MSRRRFGCRRFVRRRSAATFCPAPLHNTVGRDGERKNQSERAPQALLIVGATPPTEKSGGGQCDETKGMEQFEYIPTLWKEEKGKEKTEEKGKEKMEEKGKEKMEENGKMKEKGKMEEKVNGKEVKNGSGKNVMPIKVESPCPIKRNIDKFKENESPGSPIRKWLKEYGSPKRIYKHFEEKAKQKQEEKEEEERREEEEKQRAQREREEREQRKERILKAKVPFGEGGYGKIFLAFTGNNVKKLPKNKCVVVKICSLNSKNNIKVMENLQKHVEKSKRKRIVEMIDYGEIDSFDKKQVIVMERGGESLANKLKSLKEIDAKTLAKFGLDMALALRDFHQFAIHLDFKPNNLVYFTDEESGQNILKLIDFDGSHWIGPKKDGEDADQTERVQFGEVTPIRYKSPEQFREEKLLSRKTDIWSFGVSLYEIMLVSESKAILLIILQNILSLYRGFTIIIDENIIDKKIVYNQQWLGESKRTIMAILSFWDKYPREMRLITNVLQLEPDKRLSAKGIVGYLNGMCELGEFLSLEGNDARKIVIFNETKMEKLEQLILKVDGKESDLFMELQNVIKKQQKELLAGKKKLEKCDTKGTNFDE